MQTNIILKCKFFNVCKKIKKMKGCYWNGCMYKLQLNSIHDDNMSRTTLHSMNWQLRHIDAVFSCRCSLWLQINGHDIQILLHLLGSPIWDVLQVSDWQFAHWLPDSSHTWEELDRVCTLLHHQAVVHTLLQCQRCAQIYLLQSHLRW